MGYRRRCSKLRLGLSAALLTAAAHADARGQFGTVLNAYYGAKKIGTETMQVRSRAGRREESYLSKLDWGSEISLDASLNETPKSEPISFAESGKTLSWLPGPKHWRAAPREKRVFPISSPFPIGEQASLVRYWLATGRPKSVPILDGRNVMITPCGSERTAEGLALKCFEVRNLQWGGSLLWLDPLGDLRAGYVPTVLGGIEYLQDDVLPIRTKLLRVAAQGAERLAHALPPLASAEQRPLVLSGATLIDVVRGSETANSVIVVEGDA